MWHDSASGLIVPGGVSVSGCSGVALRPHIPEASISEPCCAALALRRRRHFLTRASLRAACVQVCCLGRSWDGEQPIISQRKSKLPGLIQCLRGTTPARRQTARSQSIRHARCRDVHAICAQNLARELGPARTGHASHSHLRVAEPQRSWQGCTQRPRRHADATGSHRFHTNQVRRI